MDLYDDDKPVGRVLTRREMLILFGGSGIALIAGYRLTGRGSAQGNSTPTPAPTPLPACVVRPELTEGPYFVDEQLNRVDIRVDPVDESIKAGLPLLLSVRVSDVTGGQCGRLPGAQIDLWHCDAEGHYSGVRDPGFDTQGEMWLRGYQLTDENGHARFLTIVPGWYRGRAVHIHFKIRTDPGRAAGYDFTSQFFFDPEQIEEIYQESPYVTRGLPDTPNTADGIFQRSDDLLTLSLEPMLPDELDEFELETGVRALFDIGLDLNAAG